MTTHEAKPVHWTLVREFRVPSSEEDIIITVCEASNNTFRVIRRSCYNHFAGENECH
jgi:hypothetical protein